MSIRFEQHGAVGSLLIDRAERRNAITLAMWQALPAILAEAEQADDLRVVTLRSAEEGAGFSAGADIGEMAANKDNPQWLAENQEAIFEAQHRLARFSLPTIAFIEGDCIGGGCGLALACDIRVATPRARFGITPAKLGLVYPFHDIKLLVDLVGPGHAKRLLYTGDLIDAVEARDIGLAQIIASSPVMIERRIAEASGASNRAMKQFIQQILDGQAGDDEATRGVFADGFKGPDFREGTAAFLEKRRPDFTG